MNRFSYELHVVKDKEFEEYNVVRRDCIFNKQLVFHKNNRYFTKQMVNHFKRKKTM